MTLQVNAESEYQPLSIEDHSLAPSTTSNMRVERRSGDVIAQRIAVIAVSVVAVATCGIALLNNPSGWFTFHPPFISIGVWAATYGILTLQPTARPQSKAAGLQRHQFWMFVSSTSMFIGTAFIYYNKYVHGKAHFASWHGLAGILAMTWTIAQIVVGAGSVWYNGKLFGGGIKAKRLWKYHRLSGYLLYTAFSAVSYLGGAWSYWSIQNSPYWLRVFAFTVCIPVMLGALYSRTRLSKMNFC